MSVNGPRKATYSGSSGAGELALVDDQLRAGGSSGVFSSGIPVGAPLATATSSAIHESEQQVDLLAGLLQAALASRGAEVGRDQPTDIERRRQQRMDDRELIVGLVLGVGVDDDSAMSLGPPAAVRPSPVAYSFTSEYSINHGPDVKSWTRVDTRGSQEVEDDPVDRSGHDEHQGDLVGAGWTVVAAGSAPVGVTSPQPGWVEQDAERIWASVIEAVAACSGIGSGRGLGRDRPLHPARVGRRLAAQHRRAARPGDRLAGPPDAHLVRSSCRLRTPVDWCGHGPGLRVDPMFSAPKMRWLLDHLPGGSPVETSAWARSTPGWSGG